MKNHNELRITAAQINSTVGDISGNTKKIIKSAIFARDKQKADVIVFPELALTGYPPEDLLLRNELYILTNDAIKQIKKEVKNIYIILGTPIRENKATFNSAIIIYNNKIITRYDKQLLCNSVVFDERQYFTTGTKTCITEIKGIKIALLICNDMCSADPLLDAKKNSAQLLISLNSSPFDTRKAILRKNKLSLRAHEGKMPIIYVNAVGAQDELVYDGGSLIVNTKGDITNIAPFFKESLAPIKIEKINEKLKITAAEAPTTKNNLELIYKTLVLGVKDYVKKNKFKKATIALSGGIDSALTLAIAVDALGKNKIETLYLPSRYSSKLSGKLSFEQSKLLGVKQHIISIEPIFKTIIKSLPKSWASAPNKATVEGNIQARCRGIILMAFSNKDNSIVISTGNKSELAVGYATLYGDMVGGFCVLKDVPKTLVYELANYRNKISQVIPEGAIKRPPSAELAKNQKDTDDLPPYPILDEILKRYVELNQSIDEIANSGFNKSLVTKIIKMVNKNEYKRRQAPPGVKITTKAFGCNRKFPITSKFNT